jgi:hypothetical protein
MIGPEEHFYKTKRLATTTNIDSDDRQQRSSGSSMDTNEERLGDINEFQQTKHHWEAKQK